MHGLLTTRSVGRWPAPDVWRHGATLVVRRDGVLPHRCVRCNRPAASTRGMTFHWHSPWLYLLILVNPVVYLIAALAVRRSARIEMSLCADHERLRSRFFAAGCVSILPPLAGLAIGTGTAMAWGIGGMLLLGLTALWGTRFLSPRCIDDTRAAFAGAGKRFLDSLPQQD